MANKKHVKMDMFTEEVIDRDDFVCESPLHRTYQKPKPATNHSDKDLIMPANRHEKFHQWMEDNNLDRDNGPGLDELYKAYLHLHNCPRKCTSNGQCDCLLESRQEEKAAS